MPRGFSTHAGEVEVIRHGARLERIPLPLLVVMWLTLQTIMEMSQMHWRVRNWWQGLVGDACCHWAFEVWWRIEGVMIIGTLYLCWPLLWWERLRDGKHSPYSR